MLRRTGQKSTNRAVEANTGQREKCWGSVKSNKTTSPFGASCHDCTANCRSRCGEIGIRWRYCIAYDCHMLVWRRCFTKGLQVCIKLSAQSRYTSSITKSPSRRGSDSLSVHFARVFNIEASKQQSHQLHPCVFAGVHLCAHVWEE